jgi:hypothetical protein
VFDLHGTHRLAEWKNFRSKIEKSDKPFRDVAEFWYFAPFVSPYLNPKDPDSWPDAWHLVLSDRLDHLAIVLGMYYTLKLTQRFSKCDYEIHMSMLTDKDRDYWLLIDNQYVLRVFSQDVFSIKDLHTYQTDLIWSDNKDS